VLGTEMVAVYRGEDEKNVNSIEENGIASALHNIKLPLETTGSNQKAIGMNIEHPTERWGGATTPPDGCNRSSWKSIQNGHHRCDRHYRVSCGSLVCLFPHIAYGRSTAMAYAVAVCCFCFIILHSTYRQIMAYIYLWQLLVIEFLIVE
jgi:hypothetical protein